MQIRLQDKSGKIYKWQVERVGRAINCMIGGSRIISGWQFTDHEGYTRVQDGNWLDLVARIRGTAQNYGLQLMSALS